MRTVEPEKRSAVLELADVIRALFSADDHASPSREATVKVLEFAQNIIQELTVENHHLRKSLFGRKSERLTAAKNQLHLFDVLEALTPRKEEPATESDACKTQKPRKPKKKRAALKPTRTEEIRVSEEERPCPECGQLRCTIGHVRSLVIEYIPPKIEVIEYLREKVACKPCEGAITTAPPPKERVIERAMPGPHMLSAVVVHKAVDGLPLQRSRKIYRRAGLEIPVTTLNRWENFAHQLLRPVIELVKTNVLGADTINLDDTSLSVRDPTHEQGVFKGHIWVYVGKKYDPGGDLKKTQEFVFYEYAPTWEAKYLESAKFWSR